MRNDQIFVLLLVILLPMSGCFDGAVGDAEGTDDGSDGHTVINYYNNTTYIESNEEVTTIFIDKDSPVTISVNGTTLMLLEHWVKTSNDGMPYWEQFGWVKYSITCTSGYSFSDKVTVSHNYDNVLLPVVPNEECDITMDGESGDRIVIFREIDNNSWN